MEIRGQFPFLLWIDERDRESRFARSTGVDVSFLAATSSSYYVACRSGQLPSQAETEELFNNNNKHGGSNQNLTLFIRGNATSGDPNVNGIKKFPNPPIINVTI